MIIVLTLTAHGGPVATFLAATLRAPIPDWLVKSVTVAAANVAPSSTMPMLAYVLVFNSSHGVPVASPVAIGKVSNWQ